MNTKDNQEAELIDPAREAFLDKYLTLANHLKVGTLDAIRLMVEVESYCATLTTPQVNGEVAIKIPKNSEQIREFIGSQFCSLEYGDKVNHTPSDDDTYTLTAHDLLSAFSMAVDCAELPYPPTPSPSNVLVDALQRDNTELKDFIAKAFLAHPNLDLDIEALATYSASTDSVSISRSEYEAMKSWKDRADWLNTHDAKDADGYEYGIMRVKFKDNGELEHAFWCNSDGSDIDAARKVS